LGFILLPSSGIWTAYADRERDTAMGLFFLSWTLFVWVMTIAAQKSNVGILLVFAFTSISLPLLSLGSFLQSQAIIQTAGAFGLLAAAAAFYTALSALLSEETSYFTLPNLKL
jgi:uncharacterized protein